MLTLFFTALITSSSLASVPLIFDADFGGPIDDTFAIAYLLKKQCDETIDIRLISVVGRNTTGRATILAKFLQESGYSDKVDIGIGPSGPCGDFFSIGCVGPVWPWMYNFDEWTLNDYDGNVYYQGIDRMIEIIEQYSETNPIYVVTVGALTNIAEIIELRPDLKKNMKLFTMSGSLFDDTEPFGKFTEFNILDDIPSAALVYNDRHIDPYFGGAICAVPWDTGYYFQIEGFQYQRLLDAQNDIPLINNLIEQYRIFYENGGSNFDPGRIFHPNNASASLYDLELVYLAVYVAGLDGDESIKTCESVDYLVMEPFDVDVDDITGLLIDIDDNDDSIPPVYFASEFKENGIEDLSQHFVDTLLNNPKCKPNNEGNKQAKKKRRSNNVQLNDEEIQSNSLITENQENASMDNIVIIAVVSFSILVIIMGLCLMIYCIYYKICADKRSYGVIQKNEVDIY